MAHLLLAQIIQLPQEREETEPSLAFLAAALPMRAVVAAAGNEDYTQGVGLPACASDAIAVGATWDSGPEVDTPAFFSNRGELLAVGRLVGRAHGRAPCLRASRMAPSSRPRAMGGIGMLCPPAGAEAGVGTLPGGRGAMEAGIAAVCAGA